MISKKYSYKEKVVEIYEKFFYGADISSGKPDFWDEFFLLKPNITILNTIFSKYDLEQLMCLKTQINRLTENCIDCIVNSTHKYRIANAAQTLSCITNGIFSAKTRVFGQTSTLIEILITKECLNKKMQQLILACHKIIVVNPNPIRLKAVIITMLLNFVSTNNLLNENPLVEYLITDEILEIIIIIISDYTHRSLLGQEALFLLTLLMQYKRNPKNYCRIKMSILEEQIVLNGISHLISLMYIEFINKQSHIVQLQKQGVFSSLTSAIGNLLAKQEPEKTVKLMESCFLLILFDFLQLNSHFSYIITSPHAVFQCPTISDNRNLFLDGQITEDDMKLSQNLPDLGSIWEDPTNILAVFLEYCSIVMQDIKEESAYNNCRLCFLILLSLAEDQNTAMTLHDSHLAFKVTIHRKRMRHRNVDKDESINNPRPLVCAIIDVIDEFLLCHIMKAFPSDLFNIAVDVIHRLVCFQSNRKLRIKYNWKPLWNSMMTLTKYLVNNYDEIPKSCCVLQLINKIEKIFNLFITYGDSFLHSPSVYDDLYYEIIRMAAVFDNLHVFLTRLVSSSDSSLIEDVNQVIDHLTNIRAIINHFNPKIQLWSEDNHIGSLSREQIMDIVTTNYDTLTLKLHVDLDKYNRYDETTQKERAFFNNLTRLAVLDVRGKCHSTALQLQNRLKEILIGNSTNNSDETIKL